MDEAERRLVLADFLRTRRRTPGLRCEKVALLANVGVARYTSLEQGREIHPSVSVLECLARALRLDPDEREYLYLPADQPLPAPAPNEEIVRLTVRRFIDDLQPVPAYVLGRRCDYL